MKQDTILKNMAAVAVVNAFENGTSQRKDSLNDIIEQAKSCLDGEITLNSIITAGGMLIRAAYKIQEQ